MIWHLATSSLTTRATAFICHMMNIDFCRNIKLRGCYQASTCHHSTEDTASTWYISRGTTACSGHTAASAWTTLHPSHSSSTVVRCCCGGSGPMTAHQAATASCHDKLLSMTHKLSWMNCIPNLHHKVTCSSRSARWGVLAGGHTSCECSLFWLPCSPCPFPACCPSSAYIPNVLLVWCSLLIYGAVMQERKHTGHIWSHHKATNMSQYTIPRKCVKGEVCALFRHKATAAIVLTALKLMPFILQFELDITFPQALITNRACCIQIKMYKIFVCTVSSICHSDPACRNT